jgi:Growth-Arrest-Specific Protein 2 Domain
MFYREGEGVYMFGTKRVYIRVENNKIVVRVGGGYLSIDEFID